MGTGFFAQRQRWALAALALALVAAPGMAATETLPAATTALAQPASSHQRLIDALTSEAIIAANRDAVLGLSVRQVLGSDPYFAQLAQEHPAFTASLRRHFAPILQGWIDETMRMTAPDRLALIRGALSDREAALLADFYASSLGEKIIVGTAAGNDFSSSTQGLKEKGNMTGEDMMTDLQASARRAGGQMTLTTAERLRLLTLQADPAFVKFGQLGPQLIALTAKAENRPMPPETQAAMAQAVLDAMADVGVTPPG